MRTFFACELIKNVVNSTMVPLLAITLKNAFVVVVGRW